LTFQEYLTARALADRKDVVEYSLMRLPDSWWREVILLVAGHLRTKGKQRVSKFIQAIIDSNSKTEFEPHHHLLVAAECLFDIGPAGVDQDLLEPARKLLQKQADAPLKIGDRNAVMAKVMASNALARIESGQVVTHFWKLPYGEPEWVTIPAGEFWMGSDADSSKIKPIHKVDLAEFRVARVPVTNAQYALFTKATENKFPSNWLDGRMPKDSESHSVVLVDWYDAIKYCEWLSEKIGKHVTLPSEAQWEKAARGHRDKREYPWGDEYNASKCNSFELGLGGTTPVGIFLNGASTYRVLDMSGSISEWTRSEYKNYPYNLDDGREEINDRQVYRVIRGGSFNDVAAFVRCASLVTLAIPVAPVFL